MPGNRSGFGGFQPRNDPSERRAFFDLKKEGFTFYQEETPRPPTKSGATWYKPSTQVATVWDGTQWLPFGGIESGSSAGVFWTRFPDGTLIQHQRVVVPFGTADLSQLDRTFPIPFVGSIPSITATVNSSSQNWNAWTGSDSLTGFTIFISRVDASGSVDRTASWQAMGRWK